MLYAIKSRSRKRWVQGAIRKKGALRADVERTFGRHGFDRKGRIKCEVLTTMAQKPGRVGKRARLAMQLRGTACPTRTRK